MTNSKLTTGSVTNSKVLPGSFSLPVIQSPGAPVNVPPNELTNAQATCFGSEILVGGGSGFSGVVADYRYVAGFAVTSQTWQISGFNAGASAMSIRAITLCASTFP